MVNAIGNAVDLVVKLVIGYELAGGTTTGAERDEIWTAQKGVVPQLAEYERTAEREIPVVVLNRR